MSSWSLELSKSHGVSSLTQYWLPHNFYSGDGTLPADPILAEWGPMFPRLCAKTGKNIDTVDTFKSRIKA